MRYFLMIGKRYLQWIDNCWYGTSKEHFMTFNSLTEVREVINNLKNHYVYDPTIWELNDNDIMKEIKLHSPTKPCEYFKDSKKPLIIKCTLKF